MRAKSNNKPFINDFRSNTTTVRESLDRLSEIRVNTTTTTPASAQISPRQNKNPLAPLKAARIIAPPNPSQNFTHASGDHH